MEKRATLSLGKGCNRPSKCPKFNTNRILGIQNLRRKVRKFCQNFIHDNITYLIKYHSTVFNNPRKTTMGQLTTVLLFIELYQNNMQNLDHQANQQQNTVCLEQQI